MSIQVLCPFFNWIVCVPGVELYVFFIYIFEIKTFSDVLLADIFSYTVSSGWMLMMVSLAMQKVFILMSLLSIFSLPLVIYWKKYSYVRCLKFYDV